MIGLLAVLPFVIPYIYVTADEDISYFCAATKGTSAEVFAKNLDPDESEEKLPILVEGINLLFAIMSYHGAGNVSTFDGLVTQSGGATVYQCYNALLAGLSGFNHGGAAPQALNFLFRLHQAVGDSWTLETVTAYARKHIIEEKKPVLAVGHALLEWNRNAPPEDQGDPRTRVVTGFLDRHFPDHWLYRLGRCWYETALPLVREQHKIAFAEVNVDGYTGILEYALGILPYGTKHSGMALVIFGFARWCAMSLLFWNCAANKKGAPGILRPGELYLPLRTA